MVGQRITLFILSTILTFLPFDHCETISSAVASKPHNLLLSDGDGVGAGSTQDQGVRAAYWPSYNTYPAASSIDTQYFSHINYAFVLPSSTNYELDITSNDLVKLPELSNAKDSWNPPAKILLSIGGGGGDALRDIFSQMASQENSRATFINSTIKVARDYNFDGVDLDWEYPLSVTDMSNLGLLFKEWREALEYDATVTGRPRLILTSAVYFAPNMEFYDSNPRLYPIQAISQYVDWINAMCYDYHGSWEDVTGLHSALYDPNTNVNTDFGIRSWIQAGVPSNKIVLGLPLYGPTWTLQDPNNNQVGAPTTGTGPGNGILVYSQIVDFNRDNDATVVFDETRVSYYSYSGVSWVSYDDSESIKAKVQYARTQALGGYFLWALGQDLDWYLASTASQAWLA